MGSRIGVVSALALTGVLLGPPRVARGGEKVCACDCDTDGRVAVGELISAVAISLARAALATCEAADGDGNGSVSIAELIAGVRAALTGCDGATPLPTRSPTHTRTPSPSPTPIDTGPTQTATPVSQIPPTNAADLLAWLEAGNYLDWPAESGPHASGGPHFGNVRTFVNDALFASLAAGDAQHPPGAAAVKELYGGTGVEVRGWSVSIKTAADSRGGANWYWLEHFNDRTQAAGQGIGLCTGCHSQDYRTFTSRDLVLIPFPFQ